MKERDVRETKNGMLIPTIGRDAIVAVLPKNHNTNNGWGIFSDTANSKMMKILEQESETAFHSGYATAIFDADISLCEQIGESDKGFLTGHNECNDRVYGRPILLSSFDPQCNYGPNEAGDGEESHAIVSAKITLTYADGSTIEREFKRPGD